MRFPGEIALMRDMCRIPHSSVNASMLHTNASQLAASGEGPVGGGGLLTYSKGPTLFVTLPQVTLTYADVC
jgi:hypothetical protein